MSWLGQARVWLRGAIGARRMEREMREELESHIAQAAERYEARGMSEQEALLAARREFGHLGTAEQAGRDVRGGQWLSGVVGDVRYALRWFARTPLTSITIVLTLALGIGFSSGVFTALDGVLRRPAPGVPNEPDLVKIRGITDREPFTRGISYPELLAYDALTDVFADVAGWVNSSVVLETGDDNIVRVAAQYVTPNFFSVLGVQVVQGRAFAAPMVGDAPDLSAVISDALAQQRFGGARESIGRRISVNGVSVTVVGVTEERFHGPVASGRFQMVWLPLSAWHPVERVDRAALSTVLAARFEAFGRLRPGLAAAGATPAVRVVAARYDAEHRALASRPWTATADVVRLRGVELNQGDVEDVPKTVMLTSAVALLILLVCTTTVNSLLVGAAAMRRHEIGVRLSLGASRARVVRQLLTEAAILAVLGGVLGLWTFGMLVQVFDMARDGYDISPNWVSIGFVLCYALATAVLSGLSPALHATRTGVANVLKDSGGGASRKSRLQRAFVVAQIAVAQPLMVALAAVMMESVTELTPLNDAPLRERLVQLRIDTWISAVRREPDPLPGLMRRLMALPGVEAVIPLGYAMGPVLIDRPDTMPAMPATPAMPARVIQHWIDPGYFAAVGAQILTGRDFVRADTLQEVTPVVLQQALARELFPSGDAVGRRLQQQVRGSDERVVLEVIGVVGEAQEASLSADYEQWPSMYLPLRRRSGEAYLMIRTTGNGEEVMPGILAAARAEARLAPVLGLNTMAQRDREERREEVQLAGALSGMGALALLLASVGLYAMVRMAVEQRRREIGIRMALGADASRVVRGFFNAGMRTTLLGLGLGLPLTVVGMALLASEVGTHAREVALAGAAVLVAVMGVAALASWLPARRAARVDAMVALRSE